MPENPPDLSIAVEKVCFVIVKAREFDVKDVVTDSDDASNASDDSMISVLEDHGDDPVADELRGFIGALNEDEQTDLVALTWLGRGDGTIEEWADSGMTTFGSTAHRVFSTNAPPMFISAITRSASHRHFIGSAA
jgi:Protein of unknown function (DUF3775)